MSETDLTWQKRAARLVRVEMARSGLNQEELARLLSAGGRPVTAQSIRSKLARGTFTAAFLLEVLDALECERIDLSDV